ncbi:MAG TPA: DnaJ C-terminal domain-containing protein [Pseudomonadales bacterium]
MEFKDYYEIMGVDEKATADDIKKAYKRLARKYHPDVSKEKNAEQRFKDVGEAYEVLKDPDKRREYDNLRAYGARGGNGQFKPPPGWSPGSGGAYEGAGFGDAEGFSDFFEAMFGRGGGFRRGGFGGGDFGAGGNDGASMRMRGEDAHVELPLFLEEAYRGSEKTVELRIPEIDEHGRRIQRTRKLKIKIPPGSSEGSVLRIKGQGAPGFGGADNGDLLATVRLAPHPLYTVDERNLTLVAPVTPWEAALGTKLTVPTLKGRTIVTIPAGSQNGTKLRLTGLGLPGTPPGDFYVVLKLVLPPQVSDGARRNYEALASEYAAFNPRSAWEGTQP